jgi:tRNA threonylcarbamoyladenosine biosynthesis protein TsaE
MKKQITTHSTQETKTLAHTIALLLNEGSVIALSGDLGAGKTTFTQGLAKGLEIQKMVSSPTFTIMKMYNGRLKLTHIDAYRLEGLHQDLGFEELIGTQGVCVIEWPEYIKELLPQDYLEITLTRLDEDDRLIELISHGSTTTQILEKLI